MHYESQLCHMKKWFLILCQSEGSHIFYSPQPKYHYIRQSIIIDLDGTHGHIKMGHQPSKYNVA